MQNRLKPAQHLGTVISWRDIILRRCVDISARTSPDLWGDQFPPGTRRAVSSTVPRCCWLPAGRPPAWRCCPAEWTARPPGWSRTRTWRRVTNKKAQRLAFNLGDEQVLQRSKSNTSESAGTRKKKMVNTAWRGTLTRKLHVVICQTVAGENNSEYNDEMKWNPSRTLLQLLLDLFGGYQGGQIPMILKIFLENPDIKPDPLHWGFIDELELWSNHIQVH